MTVTTTIHPIIHIVSTPGVRGGQPRIDGHRITVADVALAYEGARGRWGTGRIAEEFGLTLGQIHAALSYYFDYQTAIDRQIAESDSAAKRLIDQLRIPSIRDWLKRR